MDATYEFDTDQERIVYVRSVNVADLPEDVQESIALNTYAPTTRT